MRTARTNTRGPRRVGKLALVGTTALAIIGGSVLSATAANADTLSCLTTTGTTTLVNATGSGSGLINLGSTGGVIGVATGANGLQIGLLSCTAVVGLGGTAPGTTVATLNSGGTPTTPTVPTVPTATPTSTTPTTTPTATPTTAPATSSSLHTVKVSSSTATVYPSAKGYSKSRVTFSIKGLTSIKGAVKVSGKAVLKKGTKVVKTWKITGSTSKITWNGKIGKKVKAGLYTLTVKVKSAGSAYKTTTMKVRVSAKHLITKTASIRTIDLSKASTHDLPKAVKRAFKYGKVTFRIHTEAIVTGPAHLVISGSHGERVSLPLKNGSHTTKAATLTKGFTKATFRHDWKKGDATLTALYTTFTYKQLV